MAADDHRAFPSSGRGLAIRLRVRAVCFKSSSSDAASGLGADRGHISDTLLLKSMSSSVMRDDASCVQL
jgi:hypothetical protein